MGIEKAHRQIILNFCEDFDIPNVPDPRYISVVIAAIDEMKETDPTDILDIFRGPMFLNDFELYEEKVDGKNMLLVGYESRVAEQYYKVLENAYNLDDDLDMSFIISNDYDKDYNLEYLSYQFNRYLPMITTSKDISGYYDEESVNGYLLGETPDHEDK